MLTFLFVRQINWLLCRLSNGWVTDADGTTRCLRTYSSSQRLFSLVVLSCLQMWATQLIAPVSRYELCSERPVPAQLRHDPRYATVFLVTLSLHVSHLPLPQIISTTISGTLTTTQQALGYTYLQRSNYCKIGGSRTLWRAWEREPIMGVWGGAPAGLRGEAPWSWRLFCFWTLDRPVELVGFPPRSSQFDHCLFPVLLCLRKVLVLENLQVSINQQSLLWFY